MTRDGDAASREYLLRVALDEIDFIQQEFLAERLPHVARALSHPVSKFLLTQIQNLCWTLERTLRRVGETSAPRRTELMPAGIAQASNAAPVPRPRVWLDITNTRHHGFYGGVERAALRLARAGLETGLAIPVFIEDGDVFECLGANGEIKGDRLTFGPDVVYVIADSFWQQIDAYRTISERARAAGAKVVTCIHDVIPLYYPGFSKPDFARQFARSFASIIDCSDACIASSRYSQEKIRHFVEGAAQGGDRPIPLTHFVLGADGHVCVDTRQVREKVRRIFATEEKLFLSVGTLEPRKGYAVSLDAFDRVWAQGGRCGFLIVGRPGWISKSLERRIIEHPAYGRGLYWLEDASDAELTFAYRHAYCVVQASITEGFGLPIVEASLEGAPVIAADNEIFREVAGDEITYFRNCDSDDLADKITTAIADRPRPGHLRPIKWDQSLTQMIARIDAALASSTAI